MVAVATVGSQLGIARDAYSEGALTGGNGGAMGKGSSRPGVRITDQFRKRHAMVYDLSCEDVRLTIEVSPRQNDDGLGGWVVEAHARQAVDRRALLELGETRKDALRAVARAWTAKQGDLGFPELDWDAISVAMLDVRAI